MRRQRTRERGNWAELLPEMVEDEWSPFAAEETLRLVEEEEEESGEFAAWATL